MRVFLWQRSLSPALLITLACLLLSALLVAHRVARAAPVLQQVQPKVETQPVPHSGDAADDMAIWVNPSDASGSTIIGTDKKGGLAVYDLAGKQLQYLADGDMNNVDLRTNFPLGGEKVALVAASNRSNDTIAIYRINPTTRQLENVAARAIRTASPAYGACMYHSARTSKTYYFVNTENGVVEQWELFDTGNGTVDGKLMRSFAVGSQTEGCVADDQLGVFYIGEEAKGIWKYGAEPDAGTSRTLVDATGSGGHLTADVEGLTIANTGSGTGYLIASSQGNNTFVRYRREGSNSYVSTFEIVDGGGIDGVSDTDGIDVTTANLGSAFPSGVFVAQDGHNDSGNQNFKLVPWLSIVGGGSAPPTPFPTEITTIIPPTTIPVATPPPPPPTRTPTVTPPGQGHGVTVLPSADTYVRRGDDHDRNFGRERVLEIKNGAPHYDRRAFLRFDLHAAPTTIQRATLRLYVTALPNGERAPLTLRTVANDTWRETTLTWDTQPALGSVLKRATVPTTGPIEIDVTDYVRAEQSGDGLVSFALVDDTTARLLIRLSSREGTNAPQLVIN